MAVHVHGQYGFFFSPSPVLLGILGVGYANIFVNIEKKNVSAKHGKNINDFEWKSGSFFVSGECELGVPVRSPLNLYERLAVPLYFPRLRFAPVH